MNNSNNATKTTDTLSERSFWMNIGWLPIRLRPLTTLQIQEVGELALMMSEIDVTDDDVLSHFLFAKRKDFAILQEVAVKIVYRSRIKRTLFGWYIKKRLTTKKMAQIMGWLQTSVDYRFFLNSLIFLSGMKMKTKTKTP